MGFCGRKEEKLERGFRTSSFRNEIQTGDKLLEGPADWRPSRYVLMKFLWTRVNMESSCMDMGKTILFLYVFVVCFL